MSNDRILRTLQQDVKIPEVVRKKADQAFAKIRAEQEETGMDNKKVVSITRKEQEEKYFPKERLRQLQQLRHWRLQPLRQEQPLI